MLIGVLRDEWMVQKTLGYQIGVKRIIAIPFLLVLFICLVIYTLVDLTQTVQSEIKQASKINTKHKGKGPPSKDNDEPRQPNTGGQK